MEDINVSNSVNRNTGYCNSGYYNSGYYNSGSYNTGNYNSGYWNSCNRETGFFNSKETETIRVFNKTCLLSDWEKAVKPEFIYNVNPNVWVEYDEMNDEEKQQHLKAFVSEGYLKTITYKEAWKNAYEKATKEDIKLLKALPNFDANVFLEITGIEIE